MNTNNTAKTKALVRRAKKLLEDLEEEGLVLSLLTSGGQPFAVIHPTEKCYEDNPFGCYDPDYHNLGRVGVGDMIAL
jgi:hypothetical protein